MGPELKHQEDIILWHHLFSETYNFLGRLIQKIFQWHDCNDRHSRSDILKGLLFAGSSSSSASGIVIVAVTLHILTSFVNFIFFSQGFHYNMSQTLRFKIFFCHYADGIRATLVASLLRSQWTVDWSRKSNLCCRFQTHLYCFVCFVAVFFCRLLSSMSTNELPLIRKKAKLSMYIPVGL